MRLLILALSISVLGAGSFWALTQGPLAPVVSDAVAADSTRGVLPLPLPTTVTPPATVTTPGAQIEAIREQVTTQTYVVTGVTAFEILESLREHGPRDGDDIFFGLTQTDLDVRYVPHEISGGCLIEETEVDLEVVITLPEWLPSAEVDPELQVAWGRFRRALAAHEREHEVIALGGARAAYKAVAGLYRSSCDAAVTEARARLERLGVEVTAAHRRLDDETEHGRTTGAVWPQ